MAKFARKRLAKRRSKKDRDRLQRWLLVLVAILLVVYLGGAVLAPVLMKAGHTTRARRIYKAYQPACHQLAYRSFFLYGEQAVYPRDLAGVKGLKSYEAVTGLSAEDIESAKNFIGNEHLGYKTALCQRDLAIFGSILLFIIVYAIFEKRIKPLSWWLWILLAVVPIGLDGFWQVLSQLDIAFLAWLPARESTPFLRVLTGALFGIFSAWFIILSFRGEEDPALYATEIIPDRSSLAEEAEQSDENN